MKDSDKELIHETAEAAASLQAQVQGLTISDDHTLKDAAELLAEIKTRQKQLKGQKKKILDPLNQAAKELRALFKQPEDVFAEVELDLKTAMLDYHNAKDVKAQKEMDSINRRLEKGTMKIETGIAKLAGIDQADTSIGSVQFKKGRSKVRITDPEALIAAVPSLLYNTRVLEAIRLEISDDILKANKAFPGTEIYREKVVAGVAA